MFPCSIISNRDMLTYPFQDKLEKYLEEAEVYFRYFPFLVSSYGVASINYYLFLFISMCQRWPVVDPWAAIWGLSHEVRKNWPINYLPRWIMIPLSKILDPLLIRIDKNNKMQKHFMLRLIKARTRML